MNNPIIVPTQSYQRLFVPPRIIRKHFILVSIVVLQFVISGQGFSLRSPTTQFQQHNQEHQRGEILEGTIQEQAIINGEIIMPKDNSSSSSSSKNNTKKNKSQPSFDVKSCWSKAGIGTCFVLEETTHKKFQVVFDLGCTPIFDQTMTASHVVLSHVHMDHFGAIFGHARAHSMVCGGSTPTYYIPEELVPKIQKARELFSDIDATCRDDPESQAQKREKGLLNMKIVPVQAGKEIEIKQKKVHNGVKYYLRPFDVSHCGHPSLGYSLVSKTCKKELKEEYRGMDGKELGKLARSGVAINGTEIVEKIQACYSGDTNLDGLILHGENSSQEEADADAQSRRNLKEALTAPLVMCELTYILESDRELAKERGHINLFDIQPILKSHNRELTKDKNRDTGDNSDDNARVQNDQKFIFYHLSSRGRTAENILQTMATALPDDVVQKSEVALASFPSTTASHLLKDNGCISIADFVNHSPQKSFST